MQVHVRLAEPFWRAVGARDLQLRLAPQSTVGDLLTALRERYPALSAELEVTPPHVFIEDEEVKADAPLSAGSRVHLVWPIAGG